MTRFLDSVAMKVLWLVILREFDVNTVVLEMFFYTVCKLLGYRISRIKIYKFTLIVSVITETETKQCQYYLQQKN